MAPIGKPTPSLLRLAGRDRLHAITIFGLDNADFVARCARIPTCPSAPAPQHVAGWGVEPQAYALRVRRTSTTPCTPSPSVHVTKRTVLTESHRRTPFEATKEATTEINRAGADW